MNVAPVGGEHLFLFSQVLAVAGDDTFRVEHDDVLFIRAERDVQFCTRDGRRSGSVYNDFYLRYVFSGHFEGVFQSGGRYDGRAVLVVVHHRYVECALQPFLYVEAFGRLDVFKVDAAECRCDAFYSLAEFLRVFLGHLDVEHVYAAVDFEQQALALHDGLSAHRADVSESQHGCSVADYGYEVALVRVLVHVVGSLLDFKAWKRHARRVGKAKVGLRTVGLCRFYFYFSGFAAAVVFKCGFFCNVYHDYVICSRFQYA